MYKSKNGSQVSENNKKSSPWIGVFIWLGTLLLIITVWFLAWFNIPNFQWFFVNVVVVLGLVGIYPLTYIAYLGFNSETHRNLLETDFRLLGLVNEEELVKIVKELYQTVYSQSQFFVYISLIIIQSLLIIAGYLNFEKLNFIKPETMTLIFYSYLGASFFSVQYTVRRYSTFDLQPQVYSSIVARIFMSSVIVFAGASIIRLSSEQFPTISLNTTAVTPEPEVWAALLAFVIGVFPDRGIRWFGQLTNRIFNSSSERTNSYPLKNLVGISAWHEARLAEMGIDDAQNLATVDIRKLLLTTSFDTQEIVHWIDQAILYVKVGSKIERLRDAQITTFHELRLALSNFSVTPNNITNYNNNHPDRKETHKKLATVLGSTDLDELNRLSDASNFPNYIHIAEYYSRMVTVVRQQAATGMGIVVGDVREISDTIDIKERNFERVIENAKNLLHINPNDPEVLTNLGVAYYGMARQAKTDENAKEAAMKEAFNAYTRAIEQNDQMAQAFYNRSIIHIAMGKYELAMQDCAHAIEIDHTYAQAFNNRGLAYMHMGYLDLAIKDLNESLELDNRLAEAYVNRGYTYSEMGNSEMALKDFERADLLGYRKPSLFWLRWGETLWKIGEYLEAINKLSNAILHNPQLSIAYARRGDAYLQLGKKYHVQARNDFCKAIKFALAQDSGWIPDIYINLGILEAREKQNQKAIHFFNQALELKECNYSASYHLAKVYKDDNQYEELQQELHRLLHIAPPDSFEALQGRKWLEDLNGNV
ncbi:MAG: tetratricopeptide repeat protein [Anaerolineae bacterium]|nr:tetratricopeptide repeat protein [Anaerolineae bacterium]